MKRALLLLALAVMITGCGSDNVKVQPLSKEQESLRQSSDIILQSVSTKETRALVQSKYGGLTVQNFAQYFMSPEFGAILQEQTGSTPQIEFVETSDPYKNKATYPPNTILIYPSAKDVLTVSRIDDKGIPLGGYGVNITQGG